MSYREQSVFFPVIIFSLSPNPVVTEIGFQESFSNLLRGRLAGQSKLEHGLFCEVDNWASLIESVDHSKGC